MAEINTAPGSTRKGGGLHRCKKLSTRVDLTSMVDLGFLLITFFIVTTTWSEPKSISFYAPADGPPTKYPESATLTVIACDHDRVFYFHGKLDDALRNGNYGITSYHIVNGVGKIIRNKQNQMEKFKKGFARDMTLIIHPIAESNYQNIVNLLDEVVINNISYHALIDLSDDDKKLLSRHNIAL